MSLFAKDRREPADDEPLSVFRTALAARRAREVEVARLAARVLYARAKLEGELRAQRDRVSRVEAAAVRAGVRGDDALVKELARERSRLLAEVRQAEQVLERIRSAGATALSSLDKVREHVRSLERERLELVAHASSIDARRAALEARDTGADGGASSEAFPLTAEGALEALRERLAERAADTALEEELPSAL